MMMMMMAVMLQIPMMWRQLVVLSARIPDQLLAAYLVVMVLMGPR